MANDVYPTVRDRNCRAQNHTHDMRQLQLELIYPHGPLKLVGTDIMGLCGRQDKAIN